MLSVSELTYERYFEPVFEPVSFSVQAGDILLVSGNNGSGKTTLLKMLAGLLPDIQRGIKTRPDHFAYIGHQLAIKDDLNVRENLAFSGRFLGHNNPSEKTLDQIISRTGLDWVWQQTTRSLSAGQRKRCALGRLLLQEASLWLLDEPYANLDGEGIQLVDGLLKEHIDNGGACVMASHGNLHPGFMQAKELNLKSGGHH